MQQSIKESKKIQQYKKQSAFIGHLNGDNSINGNAFGKTFINNSVKLDEFKIYKERKRKSKTDNLLSESDIRISKPLTISQLESERKKGKINEFNNILVPLRGESRIILEEALEESIIKDDMEEIVKNRRMSTNSNLNTYKPVKSTALNGSLDIEREIKPKNKNSRNQTTYDRIPKNLLKEKEENLKRIENNEFDRGKFFENKKYN